jgi:hypothetical protein
MSADNDTTDKLKDLARRAAQLAIEVAELHDKLSSSGPKIFDEADFLRLVDAMSSSTGLSEATLSSRIFNDGKRIAAIRGGATITVRRMSDAVEYLCKNWPEQFHASVFARRDH